MMATTSFVSLMSVNAHAFTGTATTTATTTQITAATTTPATTTMAATTTATTPLITCPKCVTNRSGKLSCCARGGAWFKKCGDVGDSNVEHTWFDGTRACKGKLTIVNHNVFGYCSTSFVLLTSVNAYVFTGSPKSTTKIAAVTTITMTSSSATAPTTSTTTAIGPSASTPPITCPKCVTNPSGKLSCCFRGGTWYRRCGDVGDPNFDHTWFDGIQACKALPRSFAGRQAMLPNQAATAKQSNNDFAPVPTPDTVYDLGISKYGELMNLAAFIGLLIATFM